MSTVSVPACSSRAMRASSWSWRSLKPEKRSMWRKTPATRSAPASGALPSVVASSDELRASSRIVLSLLCPQHNPTNAGCPLREPGLSGSRLRLCGHRRLLSHRRVVLQQDLVVALVQVRGAEEYDVEPGEREAAGAAIQGGEIVEA